jgi:hypothetical protein
MAVSRPFLLALIGVVLLGATFFAVQNARNASGGDSAPTAAESAQPQAADSAPQLTPKQQLEAAFTNDDLESASFEGELSFSSQGEKNGIETSGSFEDRGPKEMPVADVQVRVNVESAGVKLDGGFVTTGDKAWFTRGDTAYAIPQDPWDKIVEARESGQGAGSAPQATPQLNIEPGDWLRKVSADSGGQVDGVETTHISADVDAAGAAADLLKEMNGAGQLPFELPAGVEQRAAKTLGDAQLDVWVGKDEIVRRLSFELDGKGDGGRAVQMALRFELSDVNEPQDVSAPSKVANRLPGGQYGVFARGLLAGLGGSAGVDASALGVPTTNAHLKAERAVAQGRKVVIFFRNPRALDDQAVDVSVRSVKREMKKVVVLTDHVGNSDEYGSMVEDLGVSQTPAVVVIDSRGSARLIEGYVDSKSLVQVVADAR